MSQVDAYCKGCQYLGTNSFGKWCRFNDVTGSIRGCAAGQGCTRYATGPKKHSPNYAAFAHPIPEKKQKDAEIPQKPMRPPPMTPEERYERSKAKKRDAAKEYRAKAQGRQRAVLVAYKEKYGLSNRQMSDKVGVCESTINRWVTEYVPADWDKLATVGIQKPEGL